MYREIGGKQFSTNSNLGQDLSISDKYKYSTSIIIDTTAYKTGSYVNN